MKKKPYHHKNLKQDLIEKGIEIVSLEGMGQFSLRKVAAVCGVSHGAPYSHFENKEELLSAMQEYIAQSFSKALNETIAAHKNDIDILQHLGQAYVMFFIHNPHYFSFLYTQSNIAIDLSFEEDTKNKYQPFEIYKNTALSLLDNSNDTQQKRNDIVIAMWAFVHGMASIATMKNVKYNENWEKKIVDFIEVFSCPFKKED